MMIKGPNLPDKVFGLDTQMFLLWLEPIGLAIILILSLVLVIVPKIGEISEKVTGIKSVSNKISEVNQKRNYLQTVDQEEIKNNALKLASGLLPEKNAYLLVRTIRDVAAQTGYGIDDFSISMGDIKNDEIKKDQVKKDNSSYDKIPVGVTLVGPSDSYIALVKALERSLPIMSINNFEMKLSQSGVATIKLNISAYYLRDISNLKLENLTLANLTPTQEEMNLLLAIGEYQTMSVGSSSGNESFVKYERLDPFFTP